MGKDELERVRADLDVIERAAGLEPESTRADVWDHITTGCIGALAAGAWAFTGSILLFCGIVLLGFVCVAGLLPLWGVKPSVPGKAAKKKVRVCEQIVTMILLAGFVIWTHELSPPNKVVEGAGLLMLGGLTALEAFSRFGNLPNLGYAVALMVFGIAYPFVEITPLTCVALAIATGAFVTAGVHAYRLKNVAVKK
jgi:hypothetical protein